MGCSIISKIIFIGIVSLPIWAKSALAQVGNQTPKSVSVQPGNDGRNDFDFQIGTWKTKLERLTNPLSGEPGKWVKYTGITTVKKVWDGKANLVELLADGDAGQIEALSLRLFNPVTKEWSLNFSNVKGGKITAPAIGKFHNGIGEFYNQDDLNGKMIFVKFIIQALTKDSIRFEQSFSIDGGKTWEINWIAVDNRVK